ncbi:transcription termination factor NusA [Buchananella hordeovulneris]|uniref:Transcription termination/antitermination protein NusA n=1 Tax=Buchananella hordeovulneris TaxID=52770 RepID=A0A1Q5PVX1_9ACTO|nr:transcription termination factor NusA [Buchananella hordeovulneris]MDO5081482.1 transcription termination factor NusA [Buchananella hordeovulneris]OKL51589.1 transcription termination/antitermination protein NusA [Buchananella hordeovulneris]
MDIDMTQLKVVGDELGVSVDTLVDAIEVALLKAYAQVPGAIRGARVTVNQTSGQVVVLAPEVDEEGNVIGEFDDTPAHFGRIATATVRSIIAQRLRDADDAKVFGRFKDATGQLVSGRVVQSADRRLVKVDLGDDIEAVLPPEEQVPGDNYEHGTPLRAYVIEVARAHAGAQVRLSRTHPGLVQRLFEKEVPQIADGLVEIKAIAREAGHRTKIAVVSHDPDVAAVAACIGKMGARVRSVMAELNGEKIDIVDWSSDPTRFVANALSPAKVGNVTVVDERAKMVRVIVPDYQLSLAIGKEGQNARLAARLTGWKIDIKSDTASGTNVIGQGSRPDRAW